MELKDLDKFNDYLHNFSYYISSFKQLNFTSIASLYNKTNVPREIVLFLRSIANLWDHFCLDNEILH